MPPRTGTGTRARRIPAKNKLTPEAEAELAKQGIPPGDTVSDDNPPVYDPDNPMAAAFYAEMGAGDTEQIYGFPETQPEPHGYAEDRPRPVIVTPIAEAAPMIDAAIEPPDRPLIDPEKPDRDTIRTGPPNGDEWLDFFSRIVLKLGISLYTDFVFRGVDETIVSPEDIQRIQVKKQERDTIARPFAEFATKNKYMRKHGREVVALTDSLESLMTLGILLRRINRVAGKYKKNKPLRAKAVHVREAPINGDHGQNSGDGTIGGSANGRIPNAGYSGIYNPGSG